MKINIILSLFFFWKEKWGTKTLNNFSKKYPLGKSIILKINEILVSSMTVLFYGMFIYLQDFTLIIVIICLDNWKSEYKLNHYVGVEVLISQPYHFTL